MASISHHPDSLACSKEELDLFSLPPTQNVIDENVITKINTISSYATTRGCPLEFVISTNSDYYLDASNIFLKLKLVIKNDDDTSPGTTNAVVPENNIIDTLFSDVEVLLNDVTVSSSPSIAAYRGYIEKLLNYSKGAKLSHLQNGGFFCHDGRADHSTKFTSSTNKTFEVYGKLLADIANQPRLILNGTEMKIIFHRNRPTFYMCADNTGAQGNPYIHIQEAYLLARRVKLSPQIHLSIESSLRNRTAKYPITRVEVKTNTIQQGVTSFSLEKLCFGNLPKRIIIGLVNHTNVDGVYTESSFNFAHFNVSSIALYINGHCLGTPIECNFVATNNNIPLCSRAFDSIFSAASGIDDVGNDISIDDYAKNGYTLYAFNLENDISSDCGDYINPTRRGEVSLSLSFGLVTAQPIAIVSYMEYIGLIEIDRTRNVIFNK